MATRVRRDRKTKLSVVMAAEMVGVTEAARQAGIPHSTVAYWLDLPEFVQYRRKAREDMAEEVGIVAHLAWQRVAEALRAGTMEPRDALFAADKATTLYQLVTGQATDRHETRDVTATLDDSEKQQLAEAIDGWLAESRP